MNASQPTCLAQLQEVFGEVFATDVPALTLETTADDIEQWDSLSHFELVIAIEQTFDVKITSQETRELSTVAKICQLLESKSGSEIA